MFNRKSQTILSDHYTKLIDHSSDDDEGDDADNKKESKLVGADDGDDNDDFITIKRRDHDLVESELPSSSYLSKRKLKQGQSKKAMLSHRGNPTKLVFDDEGDSHAIYELGDLEEFEKGGDAAEQQKKFVEMEKEKLKEADVKDKERQKELRREKKRKRKEIEQGVSQPHFLLMSHGRAGTHLARIDSRTENPETKEEDWKRPMERSFIPISTTSIFLRAQTTIDLPSTRLPRRGNEQRDSRRRKSQRLLPRSISKLSLFKPSRGDSVYAASSHFVVRTLCTLQLAVSLNSHTMRTIAKREICLHCFLVRERERV